MKKAPKIIITVLVVLGLGWLFFGPAKQIGYAPDQPFAYSHLTHAGKYQIDCQYCHSTVSYSKSAGIPGVNVCMNCHRAVLGLSGTAKKDANKRIMDLYSNYWEKKKAPEWVRIHNMPDHVRFSHAPHIKALLKPGQESKTACIRCHGDVAQMEVVSQVESLNMGFCLNCHREYEKDGGRTNCGACHH
ncbi:MAG: cytochrome c family protein [Spirochaetia bacterium]|nr:cytochrome c family protein [Spirochaetia bacterium]